MALPAALPATVPAPPCSPTAKSLTTCTCPERIIKRARGGSPLTSTRSKGMQICCLMTRSQTATTSGSHDLKKRHVCVKRRRLW